MRDIAAIVAAKAEGEEITPLEYQVLLKEAISKGLVKESALNKQGNEFLVDLAQSKSEADALLLDVMTWVRKEVQKRLPEGRRFRLEFDKRGHGFCEDKGLGEIEVAGEATKVLEWKSHGKKDTKDLTAFDTEREIPFIPLDEGEDPEPAD